MKKIKNILNSEKCLKIICAAGNENTEEIERLSYVYSMAGFNTIDVCAKHDAIAAAKQGMLKSGHNMAICVSIGLQDDIHLIKAVINPLKCTHCNKCINICPENALFIEDNKILTDEKKCIGCSKCIDICPNNAIFSEHKYKPPYQMLLNVLSDEIDIVEFHCSSKDIDLIKDSFNKINSIYKGVISICLDRSKLGSEEIINLFKYFINNNEDVIFQLDGNPMSGGNDNYNSALEAITFAQLINNSDIKGFITISGGINSKTTEFAKLCNVKLDGIALGSYARKIIKPYICAPDFYENEALKKAAIDTASDLFNKLTAYL